MEENETLTREEFRKKKRELHKQRINGELTKEEFRKKHHELIDKFLERNRHRRRQEI